MHSTVVRLALASRLEKLRVNEAEFIRFLKLSFAQKRKTLWNNLKSEYMPDNLKRALTKVKIKPAIRAEALSLEESAALFRELAVTSTAGSEHR